MKVGSLFTGIGGFDLAARWMGWDVRWQSEIDPYACRVLEKNFPGTLNCGDIRRITRWIENVDLLCGGFPCQDISIAGNGAGITGERSGLWSEYARVAEEKKPRWIVIENSPMLRSRGLNTVLSDLNALGYDAEWHCIPASYVGASHRRDRIWIVAYTHEIFDALQHRSGIEGSETIASAGPVDADVSNGSAGSSRQSDVAYSRGAGLQGYAGNGEVISEQGWLDSQQSGSVGSRSLRSLQYTEGWWLSEPDVDRVANGIPDRMDRIKCIGNALVPDVPYFIFKQIEKAEALLK